MRLIDTDSLKFPNIAIFDMKLHGVTVPMVRLIDLKELVPTIDAVPVVHGKWEWLSSTYDRKPCEMRYRCSKCHHETITHGHTPWEKYCPNCGARMNLEE